MSRMKIRFWWFSLAACSVLLVTSLVHLVEQQTGHPADESDSLDTTQWRTPAVEERTEGRFQAHKMLNKTLGRMTNQRIMIVTTWRSGSTFLSELLHSLPATYNHYEPLLQFQQRDLRRQSTEWGNTSTEMVDALLRCDYSKLDAFMAFARQEKQEIITRNIHLYSMCKMISRSLCFDAEYLQETCGMFPVQVMKTVRLPLERAAQLMLRSHLDNLKVILLVRDPRATMASRRRMEWCDEPVCNSAELLCEMMVADYHQAAHLRLFYPHRFTVLRYEDLASDPTNVAQSIFDWLQLPWMPEVERYIDGHTKRDLDTPWSTFKKVGSRVSAWKNDSSWRQTHHVQQVCRQALDLYGYVPVSPPLIDEQQTVGYFPRDYQHT